MLQAVIVIGVGTIGCYKPSKTGRDMENHDLKSVEHTRKIEEGEVPHPIKCHGRCILAPKAMTDINDTTISSNSK